MSAEAARQHSPPADIWLQVAALSLAAAAWLVMHRNSGIWHDAVLYAVQALHRIDPEAFRGDVFFFHVSQDQYTVFTAIYAATIRWLGLPSAAALLLGAAHLCWIVAVFALFRQLLRERTLWFALLLVAVLPSGYGSSGLFAYAEPFLTARIWAEAAALLATAFALGHRPGVALVLVFAAAGLHPPMALPAAMFVALAAFPVRTAIPLIGAAAVVVLALAMTGIGPFDQLLVVMDDPWLRIATERSPFAFVAQWPSRDFAEPFLLGLVLAAATACAEGTQRRAWVSGLAVFGMGAALSLLTVLWPSALLVQLQPWRALWLTKILAIAAAVWLMQAFWNRSSFARLLLAGMAGAVFTADGPGLLAAGFVAVLLVAHHRGRIDVPLPRLVPALAWLIVAAIAAEAAATSLQVGYAAFNVPSRGNQAFGLFHFLAESGWFLFPAAGAAAWWVMQRWPRTRYALAFAGTAFAAYCAWHWSDPAARQNAALRDWQQLAPLVAAHAPRGDLIYWEDNVTVPWLGLQRGNYVSPQQGAGVIFSETTAREFVRRSDRAAALNPAEASAWRRARRVPATASARPDGAAAIAGLAHLCGDPLLDHVVLARDIGGSISHRIPAGRYGGPFYLYDCASLRQPSHLSH